MESEKEKLLECLQKLNNTLNEVAGFKDDVRIYLDTIFGKLQDMQDDIRLIKSSFRDVDRRLAEHLGERTKNLSA